MLIGLLLGDAHIQRRSPTANSRLMYGQSEVHKEYFYHIFNIFKSFCFAKRQMVLHQKLKLIAPPPEGAPTNPFWAEVFIIL